MTSHWLYGRSLGLITLLAFLSYWWQGDCLIGENGLSPWKTDLQRIEKWDGQNSESSKWSIRPTLLWLQPFANHHLLFSLGSVSALLLTIGFFPTVCGITSYLCYLSLMVVGEPFLSFQWDILLCETLLLSIPFLPLTKFHGLGDRYEVPWIARYLIVAILAKLMLESGIVKFTSFGTGGENTWRDLTALEYHYWTQPLPHRLSPWFHSLPEWIHQFSLYSTYTIELILPFFLFLPGTFRRIGVMGQILLQLAILASGNYGFFNLLTLCLCIPLLDDSLFPSFILKQCKSESKETIDTVCKRAATGFHPIPSFALRTFLCVAWVFLAITTYGHMARDLRGNHADPWLELETGWTDPFSRIAHPTRAFNSYGLFRVMTTTRPEIVIEGSMDGKEWWTYEFPWKPTDTSRAPRFAGPHMPRLDWQMWFEGLNYERFSTNPFSLLVYHNCLSFISLGNSVDDLRSLPTLLGETEYARFLRLPEPLRQKVLENCNSMLHAFSSRSLWFGNLLHAIFEARPEVMRHLSGPVEHLQTKPVFLRISLHHYCFAENSGPEFWTASPIEGASLIVSRKE